MSRGWKEKHYRLMMKMLIILMSMICCKNKLSKREFQLNTSDKNAKKMIWKTTWNEWAARAGWVGGPGGRPRWDAEGVVPYLGRNLFRCFVPGGDFWDVPLPLNISWFKLIQSELPVPGTSLAQTLNIRRLNILKKVHQAREYFQLKHLNIWTFEHWILKKVYQAQEAAWPLNIRNLS